MQKLYVALDTVSYRIDRAKELGEQTGIDPSCLIRIAEHVEPGTEEAHAFLTRVQELAAEKQIDVAPVLWALDDVLFVMFEEAAAEAEED